MNIKEALIKQEKFTDSEKELANFILKKKEKILNMSVQEISEQTYTSTSAVVRLCRKINLKGFKDFKIKYSAELQQDYRQITDIDANFPIDEDDTISELAAKLLNLTKSSLDEAHQMCSPEAIEKTVSYILNSKNIAVIAVGDSYIRAVDFQNKMMKINKHVILSQVPLEDGHLSQVLDSNDCVIFITYSGQTKYLVPYAQILSRNLVTIITITSNPDSIIGRLSDIVLQIPNRESKSIKITTFHSQACIEYYLNIIYSYFFVLNYDKNLKRRTDSEISFLDTRY